MPTMARASVDLPDPLSPTTPRHSPGCRSKLISDTARSFSGGVHGQAPRGLTSKVTDRSRQDSSAVMASPRRSGRGRRGACRRLEHLERRLDRRRRARAGTGSAAVKGQPAGSRLMSGGSPAMVSSVAVVAVEPRHRLQQPQRVGMRGRGEDVGRRALFHDLAAIEHQRAVAEVGDDAEIVGDQDDRRCRTPRGSRRGAS